MSDHPSGFDPSEDWINEPPGTDEARRKRKANGLDSEDFTPRPWVYRDPATIEPREWLIGTMVLRGYATVLGSMGGVGKTALAIGLALSFITGRRDIVGQHVFQRGKAWLITLEDDRLELERRIAAAMLAHGIRPDEVEGKLFVNDSASDRPLLLARADENGIFVVCDDAERLRQGITGNNIGLTVIDPLVKAHAVIENNNAHMDRLIGLGNEIAKDTRSGLMLPCHFRKGGGENGARDAIRGGASFVDGARVTRTLVQMTGTDAEALKISPENAFRHICVQDPKANMAPRHAAAWIELVSIPLGNTEVNPVYPAGDNVQVAKEWSPPSAFDGIDLATLRMVFDELHTEPEPGWFYSVEPRAKHKAVEVLIARTGKSKVQAAAILKKWQVEKVVASAPYKTPSRNDATRVVLNEVKVAEILAPARSFGDLD